MSAWARRRAQLGAECFDVLLAIGAPLVQGRGDVPIVLGLQIAEGQILELPFELPCPQPVGERREDRAGLEREPLTDLGRRVARVAQRDQLLGEAREDQPGIADHRKQHLAHGFGLAAVEALGR